MHLIAEGVNIETFLKGAGPFKDTVAVGQMAGSRTTPFLSVCCLSSPPPSPKF